MCERCLSLAVLLFGAGLLLALPTAGHGQPPHLPAPPTLPGGPAMQEPARAYGSGVQLGGVRPWPNHPSETEKRSQSATSLAPVRYESESKSTLPLPEDPSTTGPAAALPPPRKSSVSRQPSGRAANLAVECQGASRISPGQPWRCSFIVRNRGSSEARGVRLELPLPAGVRVLSSSPQARDQGDQLLWELGELLANSMRTVSVELEAPSTTRQRELILEPAVRFQAPLLRAQLTRPNLEVHLSAPSTASLGSEVAFKIEVVNHGQVPLHHVSLRDQLPAGLRHAEGNLIEADLGTLEPGQRRSVTLRTTAVQVGEQVNHLLAQAEGGQRAQTRTTVLVKATPLQFTIRGPKRGVVGQSVEFQLEVVNPGSQSTGNVQLQARIPEGLTFVSASAGGTLDSQRREVNWNLLPLSAGQRGTVTLRFRTQREGEWSLEANVQDGGNTSVTARHTIHVEGATSLSLEVLAYDNPIRVGQETTYEIRVLNRGKTPGNQVQLTVQLPEGLRALKPRGATSGRIQGNQVTFVPLTRLPARANVVYRIRAEGSNPGTGLFVVELGSHSMPRAIRKELEVRVMGRSERRARIP